jgi:hypothetical protein
MPIVAFTETQASFYQMCKMGTIIAPTCRITVRNKYGIGIETNPLGNRTTDVSC